MVCSYINIKYVRQLRNLGLHLGQWVCIWCHILGMLLVALNSLEQCLGMSFVMVSTMRSAPWDEALMVMHIHKQLCEGYLHTYVSPCYSSDSDNNRPS